MEPVIGLNDPIYVHLLKATYALADAMAMTHEIQEIFIQQKDMEFEDWVQKLRQLLAQIDREIFLRCEVPVLHIGLHSIGNFPEANSPSGRYWEEMPNQVLAAASAFGTAFDLVAKIIDQEQKSFKEEKAAGDTQSTSKMSLEKIELCKRITELLLNELGLKGSDIARIY